MIKASILDADTDEGGELLRLLIHHPDIHLLHAQSTDRDGQLVCDYHYGLVGETDLRFTAEADLTKSDVVFTCRRGADLTGLSDDAKIVDLSGEKIGAEGFVLGVGELNRKDMVRGATRAAITTPAVQAAIIALLPLAKRGDLRGDILVNVPIDADIALIDTSVRALFPDFAGNILRGDAPVEYTAQTTLTTNCTGSDVRALYREAFDDHNFVFVISRLPISADVTNTNKCLLHIDVVDNQLTITALMDQNIKGRAGTAVHCMNLLFGLHEVIGLQTKALGR